MNRFALVGAALAVLVCAAVAMAASPGPMTSPTASPYGSPGTSAAPTSMPSKAPSASPSASANAGSSAAQGVKASPQTWTADVNPVNIQGSATLTRNSDGTGTLQLKLTGMVNEQNWTVDVEPGDIQHPNNANTIAFKQGSDVSRVSPDTIQVMLTKAEMQDFDHALSSNPGGVTVFVSDGHRLSAANIPAPAQ